MSAPEPWLPSELRAAVERELDVLGNPDRCRTRADLSKILTADCTVDQLIARYLWGVLAVSGASKRDWAVSTLEGSAIDARDCAAEVGQGPGLSVGTPIEILAGLGDDSLHGSPAGRVEGLPRTAAAVFIAVAMKLAGRLVTPRAGLDSGVNGTLLAHDTVAAIVRAMPSGSQDVPSSWGAALTSALRCAIRLRDGRPMPPLADDMAPHELCAQIAHMCVAIPRLADQTAPVLSDEETWAEVERRTADRIALIVPSSGTQLALANAVLEILTDISTFAQPSDALRGDMLDATAIAATAFALESWG